MRGFLGRTLVALGLGRAAVALGLGPRAGAPTPPAAVIAGPCYTARLAPERTFTAALAPELEASGSFGSVTFAATIGDVTFTGEVSSAC